MYTKTRQNLQMTGNDPCFVDTPGYLWHYEPFDTPLFIHHAVVGNKGDRGYRALHTWKVSDPTTGLGITPLRSYKNRAEAVDAACERLADVTMSRWNEARLRGLAQAPDEGKPRWRIKNTKGIAIEVKDEMV